MNLIDDVTASLAERVRIAAAAHTPLRIRGGGSKDFYGQALEGELLHTGALNGVVSYEPSELVVTALAGTPLADVEALLAAQGQCFAFEPPHFGPGSTVGGMVASGLAGPARASVGGVRDYVLGVKFINGKGEHLTFGGQVMKNVAGYDVSRLMAGSMGTLGLLTEISLKVLPVATAEATLRFDCTQAQALNWLNAWGGQPLPLNASCWVCEDAAATPGADNQGAVGQLYLRLRGALAAVESACVTLAASAGGQRMDTAQAAAQAASDWQALRNQQLQWFSRRSAGQDLWRLSVPQTAAPLSLPAGVAAPLVEWHGGLRWVAAAPEHAAALRAAAQTAGGHATLFIANNSIKTVTNARFDALKPPLDRISRDLKHQFDPAGILNPHRLNTAW